MATDKNINDSALIKLEDADFADALNRFYGSRVGGTEDGYGLFTELITYIQSLGVDAKTITISMLADGTDGELITWDANGEASVVPAGTAAQVLTSNGAGASPTFQTLSASGEWTIASNKLSNDTQAVDYISLYAKNVEVARVGNGTNPFILLDPAETRGNTTGVKFGSGGSGFYESTNGTVIFESIAQARAEFHANYIQSSNVFGYYLKRAIGSATVPSFAWRGDTTTGMGHANPEEGSLIAGGVEIIRFIKTGAYVKVIKSGDTQGNAGANAGELWKTASHATLPDNVVMIGV